MDLASPPSEVHPVQIIDGVTAIMDSAFPNYSYAEGFGGCQGGLSKREYFAAMAMQESMAHPASEHWSAQAIAETSVQAADALIAELAKTVEE